MKNAKKILLFLGAISLVAFGSFNMTGNKSNKNTVAESKETETDKKENKKADAVAVAVENNGQAQNTPQTQPVVVTPPIEGAAQGQPAADPNARNNSKQSQKKSKKTQKAVQSNSQVKENAPAEVAPVVKETPKTETTPAEQPVLTQNDEEETVVIPKEEVKKKKETPKENKPTPKKPQKPAASTTDALSSVLNASVKNPNSGNGSGSQGDDNVSGYKGDPKGNPYASSFFGDSSDGSGSGSGKSWGLNGRRYISGEKIFQDCNESGLVIVQIEVDRSGKVVRAKAGEKGTTNKAPCLLDAARKSAMTYRFNADEKAPQTQIGFLSIRFKLGE